MFNSMNLIVKIVKIINFEFNHLNDGFEVNA